MLVKLRRRGIRKGYDIGYIQNMEGRLYGKLFIEKIEIHEAF